MSDLLNEAIEDANAVRDMALKQAKLVLEQAFGPSKQPLLALLDKEYIDDDTVPTIRIPAYSKVAFDTEKAKYKAISDNEDKPVWIKHDKDENKGEGLTVGEFDSLVGLNSNVGISTSMLTEFYGRIH